MLLPNCLRSGISEGKGKSYIYGLPNHVLVLFRHWSGQTKEPVHPSSNIQSTTANDTTAVSGTQNNQSGLDLKTFALAIKSDVETLQQRLLEVESTIQREKEEEESTTPSIFSLQSDNNTTPDLMAVVNDLRTKMLLNARSEKRKEKTIIWCNYSPQFIISFVFQCRDLVTSTLLGD
jgi:hypothetical protein